MDQPIIGFRRDVEGHWVAEWRAVTIGTSATIPPWAHRAWVERAEGRAKFLGRVLLCKKSDRSEPPDRPANE
jgi:hypothetical protein